MSYTNDNQGGDTAQFQAFADRQDESPSAWDTRGSRSRVWLIAGAVVAAVAVAALMLTMVTG